MKSRKDLMRSAPCTSFLQEGAFVLHDALIRKLSSVAQLTDREIMEVRSICQDVHPIARRRDVVSEGHHPDRVHIVLSGWAARYNVLNDGSRRITAFLLPGDFCDINMTVLGKMDHGIIALTECKIAFVSPDRIGEIERSAPALARALLRCTLIGEAMLRRWLVKGGRSNAYEAVGHLISELHFRARLVGLTDDHTLRVPVTQEEIGDATGLTTVHVNRVLKRLRDDGIATIRARKLTIHDMKALHRESGFDPNYLYLSSYGSRA